MDKKKRKKGEGVWFLMRCHQQLVVVLIMGAGYIFVKLVGFINIIINKTNVGRLVFPRISWGYS